jgi:flavin reductase (DIM6/NTAB) family NADH-FMN oxidoreductase RutF
MRYSKADFESWEKLYRTAVFNTLGGFKTPVLVGTKHPNTGENVAIFSNHLHIGANPPLVGLLCRPSFVPRNTYGNILDTKMCTINIVSESYYKQAHQTSARYEPGVSEFAECGLEPQYLNDFAAPYVAEASIKYGCSWVETHHIGNGTHLLVLAIDELHLPDNGLTEDGSVKHGLSKSLAVCGLEDYYKAERLEKLAYAKVGKAI